MCLKVLTSRYALCNKHVFFAARRDLCVCLSQLSPNAGRHTQRANNPIQTRPAERSRSPNQGALAPERPSCGTASQGSGFSNPAACQQQLRKHSKSEVFLWCEILTHAFASRCAEGHHCCVWIVGSIIMPSTALDSSVRRLFHRVYQQPGHVIGAIIDPTTDVSGRAGGTKNIFEPPLLECFMHLANLAPHICMSKHIVESLQRPILYPFALLRFLASAAKPPRPPGPPQPHIIEEQRRRREMLAAQAAEEQIASPVSFCSLPPPTTNKPQ